MSSPLTLKEKEIQRLPLINAVPRNLKSESLFPGHFVAVNLEGPMFSFGAELTKMKDEILYRVVTTSHGSYTKHIGGTKSKSITEQVSTESVLDKLALETRPHKVFGELLRLSGEDFNWNKVELRFTSDVKLIGLKVKSLDADTPLEINDIRWLERQMQDFLNTDVVKNAMMLDKETSQKDFHRRAQQ